MKQRKLLLLIILLILLSACGSNAPYEPLPEPSPSSAEQVESSPEPTIITEPAQTENTNYYNSKYARISHSQWDSFTKGYCRFEDAKAFLEEVDEYIDEIFQFLKKTNQLDRTISFELIEGISNVDGGNISLKKDLFEYDLAPIAHEITHIIYPNNNSTSLSEGFASYCQDMFGKNPSIYNFGLDIDACSNVLLIYEQEEFDKVFVDIGVKGSKNTFAYEKYRQWFYMLSNSFVTFLINTYGMDNFMVIYEASDLYDEYENTCGKSLNELKAEWRQSIEEYSSPISKEYYQLYRLELFDERNHIETFPIQPNRNCQPQY